MWRLLSAWHIIRGALREDGWWGLAPLPVLGTFALILGSLAPLWGMTTAGPLAIAAAQLVRRVSVTTDDVGITVNRRTEASQLCTGCASHYYAHDHRYHYKED